MSIKTWTELLDRAALPPDQTETLKTQILATAVRPPDPAWLKALAAIAGWIACLFLAPFFGAFGVFDNEVSLSITGGLLLGGGILMMRQSQVLFVHHLALAFSLLGTGMIVLAAADLEHDFAFGRLLLVQAAIAAIGYVLVPSSAYRFLVTVNTAFLMVCWLVMRHNYAWMPLWVVSLAMATGLLWGWRARPAVLNALAYACAFSLAGTLIFDLMIGQFRWWEVAILRPEWTSLPVAGVFIALVASFTGGSAAFQKPWMWAACGIAGLIGLGGEAGLMVALLLLVISFAWEDRLLTVLAYVFLGGFLFMYYYSLQVPLVAKSWIVGGSGVLLLVLRGVLHLLEKKGGTAS